MKFTGISRGVGRMEFWNYRFKFHPEYVCHRFVSHKTAFEIKLEFRKVLQPFLNSPFIKLIIFRSNKSGKLFFITVISNIFIVLIFMQGHRRLLLSKH